jgi:hypothetical protein
VYKNSGDKVFIQNFYGEPVGRHAVGNQGRWEDNIMMGLRVIGCDNEKWIDLAQGVCRMEEFWY